MAHTKLMLKHPRYGKIKTGYIGASWTTCFFGFIPALLRGDLKWSGINLVVTIILGIIFPVFGVMISAIIFGVLYNKLHLKDLLDKGYMIADKQSKKTIEELEADVELPLSEYVLTE